MPPKAPKLPPAPPAPMTWGKAGFVLVICVIFDIFRLFFQFFWFFGPALAAALCTAGVNTSLGVSIANIAGQATALACTATFGGLGFLAAGPIAAFGVVMAMAVGLLGWMTVGTILLMFNRKIFTENGVWFGASLLVTQVPFIGSIPAISLATARMYHHQIKLEKAELAKYKKDMAAREREERQQQEAEQMQAQALAEQEAAAEAYQEAQGEVDVEEALASYENSVGTGNEDGGAAASPSPTMNITPTPPIPPAHASSAASVTSPRSISPSPVPPAQSDRLPFPALTAVKGTSHHGLSELAKDPETVIRKERLRLGGLTDEGPTSAKTTKKLSEGKQMFTDLREKYNVPVPDFEYVIAENPDKQGTPWLYTVTEKVHGQNLEEVQSFNKQEVGEVDNALSGTTRQIGDAYNQNGVYWLDADKGQFMLGRKKGDTAARVYATDLEPRTGTFAGTKTSEYELLAKLHNLLENVEHVEARSGGVRLEKSRKVLSELLSNLPPPGPEETYFDVPLLPAYQDMVRRLNS